jgi:hypothetical protein
VLRLRGRVHRLDKIELALSVRVIDSLPFKRMAGLALSTSFSPELGLWVGTFLIAFFLG